MKKGLDGCDIVMMLRLQNERMQGSFLPSKREYYEFFGLTPEKLKLAKKDAFFGEIFSLINICNDTDIWFYDIS